MALTRDQIRASLDLPTEYVETPRWGGGVNVRAMPMASAAYVGFKNRPLDNKGTPPSPEEYNTRRMVGAVILCTVDDEGNRIFEWKDAEWLREKHWLTVLAIATKAFELAGDGPEPEVVDGEVAESAQEAPESAEDGPEGKPRMRLAPPPGEGESGLSEPSGAAEGADTDPLPPTSGS